MTIHEALIRYRGEYVRIGITHNGADIGKVIGRLQQDDDHLWLVETDNEKAFIRFATQQVSEVGPQLVRVHL